MDLADQVEIDEAVVHRRHQRVGLEDRRTGDRIVAAGRVDHDDVRLFAQPAEGGFEPLLALVVENLVGGLR